MERFLHTVSNICLPRGRERKVEPGARWIPRWRSGGKGVQREAEGRWGAGGLAERDSGPVLRSVGSSAAGADTIHRVTGEGGKPISHPLAQRGKSLRDAAGSLTFRTSNH